MTPQKKRPLAFIALALMLAGALWYGAAHAKRESVYPQAALEERMITVADTPVSVWLARSEAERELGLSGVPALKPDHGMLFLFGHDDTYAFWMKDMLFPIDMIWISATGTVVYVMPDVSPASYPASFAPPTPSRSVLELPAGWAAAHNLKAGDKVGL